MAENDRYQRIIRRKRRRRGLLCGMDSEPDRVTMKNIAGTSKLHTIAAECLSPFKERLTGPISFLPDPQLFGLPG